MLQIHVESRCTILKECIVPTVAAVLFKANVAEMAISAETFSFLDTASSTRPGLSVKNSCLWPNDSSGHTVKVGIKANNPKLSRAIGVPFGYNLTSVRPGFRVCLLPPTCPLPSQLAPTPLRQCLMCPILASRIALSNPIA